MAHDDLDASPQWHGGRPPKRAAPPVDLVRPFVDVLERGSPDAPDTRLLRAAFGHALDYMDASVDAESTPLQRPSPATATATG